MKSSLGGKKITAGGATEQEWATGNFVSNGSQSAIQSNIEHWLAVRTALNEKIEVYYI